MADTWQQKGLDDFRREANCVPDHMIRMVLERYVSPTADFSRIIPQVHKVLTHCLMLMHSDDAPSSQDISRASLLVLKQASDLHATLSALPQPAKRRIEEAAFNDCDARLAGLGRGDPFALDARFDDAAITVEALSRWAQNAVDGAEGAKRGRPVKDAPTASVAVLGRFYQRLTGTAPSRVTKQAETPPFGHVEDGEFGRFARDLSGLIGVRLSDDALKRGIARLKVKNGGTKRPNSPLDASVLIDPEKTAEAQDGPERLQGSSEND